MALDKSVKLAIQAKLRLGMKPKEVSDELGVKLPTVYAISQALKLEVENETIQELNTIPMDIIQHVVEEAKQDKSTAVSEAFEAVSVGVDGLKKLDMSFQSTMTNVLKRFDLLLLDKELPLKDIVTIANTTAAAYEKVFTSGTNIHIGDNNSQSNSQLTVFKNKQGV